MSQSYILQLPHELLGHICSFLSAQPICQLESSSASAKEALEKAGVWTGKALQYGKESKYSLVLDMLELVSRKKIKNSRVMKVRLDYYD